jgi:hypothetical protein
MGSINKLYDLVAYGGGRFLIWRPSSVAGLTEVAAQFGPEEWRKLVVRLSSSLY